MDRGQGARERVAQLGGALNATLARVASLSDFESRALDRVGEVLPGTTGGHLGLGALDSEFGLGHREVAKWDRPKMRFERRRRWR
jgi:hypothetical protein